MKTVKKRMKEFKRDLLKWREYDFVIINDDLKFCYKEILKRIKSNRKVFFDKNFIELHVKRLLN